MTPQASRVLLISDNPSLANLLFDTLDESAYFDLSICLTNSASAALEIAATQHFALLVTDSLAAPKSLSQLISLSGDIPMVAFLNSPSKAQYASAFEIGIADIYAPEHVKGNKERLRKSLTKLMKRSRIIRDHTHLHHELIQSLEELESDQQAAFHIQQNMMPPSVVQCGDITAEHLVSPSLYLSGDFVDLAVLDDQRCALLLADVSGHGASSALVTVLLKNMMQGVVRNYREGHEKALPSLSDLLVTVNKELIDTRVGKHLTIFLAIIDQGTKQMHYVTGGHHPSPILTDDNGHRFLTTQGSAVGLFPKPKFTEQCVNLAGQFQVTACSDGLLELIDMSNGVDKNDVLLSAVEATLGQPPSALKALIGQDFAGSAPDDIAIVTVRGHLE
ncbi:MAG: SpoIIE family protein phosphatase [Pontibacterium sp.]